MFLKWIVMLRALVFDVDGTLADTERAHRAAFNQAFAEVGRDWVWDEALYIRLLDILGGRERILHYWRQVQPDFKDIDGAGLATLITPNSFTAHHDFTGVLHILPDLQDITAAHLCAWHAKSAVHFPQSKRLS